MVVVLPLCLPAEPETMASLLVRSVPSEDHPSDASSNLSHIFEDGSESGLSGQPPLQQKMHHRHSSSFDLPSDLSGGYDPLRGSHVDNDGKEKRSLSSSPPRHIHLVGEMMHVPSLSPTSPDVDGVSPKPPAIQILSGGPTIMRDSKMSTCTTPESALNSPPRRRKNRSIVGRFSPGRLFGSRQNPSSPSAVDIRNDVFADWEAAPRSPTQQTRLWRTGNATSRVVERILHDQRRKDARRTAVWHEGLDQGRATADELVSMLQLGDEGMMLLQALRGRAGAVTMDEDENGYNCDAEGVPYLHLQDDFWVPHYEEFVVRKVNAFGRYLTALPSLPKNHPNNDRLT